MTIAIPMKANPYYENAVDATVDSFFHTQVKFEVLSSICHTQAIYISIKY